MRCPGFCKKRAERRGCFARRTETRQAFSASRPSRLDAGNGSTVFWNSASLILL
jgi:hypothetical protein